MTLISYNIHTVLRLFISDICLLNSLLVSLSQLYKTVKEKQCARWITGALLVTISSNASICHLLSFERIETTRFVFLCHAEAQKAGRFLARHAEAISDEVSQLIGFSLRNKVTVILLPAGHDLKSIAPDLSPLPSWATGAAYPEQNTIVIFIRSKSDIEKTFRHEVHHILLGQAFRGSQRVPRWLDEGLAMLLADEWNIQRLATMTMAVLSKNIIPMEQLVKGFPADLQNAELAYCQSFYFISFLKGSFGEEAFQTFLRAYSSHGDFYAALRHTYGYSWEEVERKWRDYLSLRFSWIPLITSSTTLWFIATLLVIAGYVRKRRQRLRLEAEQKDAVEEVDGQRGKP
ncbi:MAG: peptidase MA family metallohydrolase [Desulfobacterota bacterium]|nr:peptidase MA family metallohydrolase [Thermodesulfobacteriota bacterium]